MIFNHRKHQQAIYDRGVRVGFGYGMLFTGCAIAGLAAAMLKFGF